MHSNLDDWKNGWYGIDISLKTDEIDSIIDLLNLIKKNPDQHFHLSSDFKGTGGVGQITFDIQHENQIDNMINMGKALAPGEIIKTN